MVNHYFLLHAPPTTTTTPVAEWLVAHKTMRVDGKKITKESEGTWRFAQWRSAYGASTASAGERRAWRIRIDHNNARGYGIHIGVSQNSDCIGGAFLLCNSGYAYNAVRRSPMRLSGGGGAGDPSTHVFVLPFDLLRVFSSRNQQFTGAWQM